MNRYFICILLFLSFSFSTATGFYGNQSHLEYNTATTRYFSLHYPLGLKLYSDEVATLAETVSDTLIRRYGIDMPRLDVVLEEGLLSNGQANSAKHSLKLWISDWGFKLRSTHPWLPDVVTHEFSHIVSLYAGAKTKPWLFGVHLGYQDYYNEALKTDWGFVLSTGLASAWLAEGTAQYESTRLGFDRWDSHRDMVIRMAALNDEFISYDLMNVFQSEMSIDLERGPYTQGFDLIRYISQVYGDDKVVQIWKQLGSLGNWSTESAIASALNISVSDLFENYKKDRIALYENWKNSKTFTEHKALSQSGYWTSNLRLDKKNQMWGHSNFGGPDWEGGIFTWNSKIDSSKNQSADSLGVYELGAYAQSDFEFKKVWLDNGFDIVEGDSSVEKILAIGYAEKDKNGQSHFNLMSYDLAQKEIKYLTKNLDLRHPSISHNQENVVLVKKEKNRNRFVLGEYSFKDSSYKDLWVPFSEIKDELQAEKKSFQIFNPRYSADDQKILFTWYDQKNKYLSEFDKKTNSVKNFLVGGGDHRDAIYADKDESIIFSSDLDGVFNLYKYYIKTAELKKITEVEGGAFEPLLVDSTLHFVAYDKNGFNWYKLEDYKNTGLNKTLILENANPEATIKLEENYGISSKSKSYNAIPRKVVLAPLFIGQESPTNTDENTEGEARYKIGVSFSLSDPIDENTIDGVVLLEVGQGFDYINGNGVNPAIQRDFSLGWTNKTTPIDLSLRFTNVNVRGQDSLKSEDPSVKTILTHYSNEFMNLHGQADYALFKKGDLLTLAGGAQKIGFNLYEGNAPFSYDVYKSWYSSVAFQLKKFRELNGSAQISPGYGFGTTYKFESADLFRPKGKFSESFEVNSAGVVNPIFTEYQTHSIQSDLLYALPLPFLGGIVSAEVLTQSMLSWNSNEADTLDGFFLPGVSVPGYPYLVGEDVLFRGENNIQSSLRYNFNLYKVNKGFRAFHHVGAWLDMGYHLSSVYDGKFYEFSKMWAHSLHSELRFSNRIFYGIPMEIFGRAEWGLTEWNDYTPEAFGDIKYAPTRIQAGLVFRFDNPGELIDLKPKRGFFR